MTEGFSLREHFMGVLADRWADDDQRRQVFIEYGVLVRMPCLAALLLSEQTGDHQKAVETARAIGRWLGIDVRTDSRLVKNNLVKDADGNLEEVPFGERQDVRARVFRLWNYRSGYPLKEKELFDAQAWYIPHGQRGKCDQDDVLSTTCVGRDRCDFIRAYFKREDPLCYGFRGLKTHGVERGTAGRKGDIKLKLREMSVYELICELEDQVGEDTGCTLWLSGATARRRAKTNPNAILDILQTLESAGLIVVGEYGESGKSGSRFYRVAPLPLIWNDEAEVPEPPKRDSQKMKSAFEVFGVD